MPSDPARPWLRFYGDVPATLDYPPVTLYQAVMNSVRRVPDAIAYEFLGYRSTYREFGDAIGRCAGALARLGLGEGDRITISIPTSPQGVIAFYAAIRLGAVPSMIHPLSTAPEIEFYLKLSRSRFALTLDAFYGRFAEVRKRTPLETLILARIPDYLSPLKRLGFWLTRGRKIAAVPGDARVHWWSDLMAGEYPEAPVAEVNPHSRLIRTRRPTVIAGVPTLFDALARDPSLRRADLSCLRAAFSGADTLPHPVKERFEDLAQRRGGSVRLLEACVIGVPDEYQGERVKVVVVPRDPGAAGPPLAGELIAHCQEQIIKWSCPRETEFRCTLPRTRIGKIDFKSLIDEERARLQVAG